MTRISNARAAVAVLPLLALLAVGCSSDGGGDDELTLPGAGTPTAEPTDEPADDVADLEALYSAYWDVMIELENSEEMPGPEIFDGIAGSELMERQMARVRNIKESGRWRQGEPLVEQVTVEVDGDTAVIQSCVNEDDWEFVYEGETVPLDPQGPKPRVMEADRGEDGWLLGRTLAVEEATISC
jgi:hypothetical protein